jgi:hypothetical protein
MRKELSQSYLKGKKILYKYKETETEIENEKNAVNKA